MTGPVTARHRGEPVTVFSSNDYLGLAQHPEMQAAWNGRGAGSSRLIAGDRAAHHALEAALSERFGRAATLFNTGYMANLALLTVLVSRGDRVASDALNHASIIDGIRLSGAEKTILEHGCAPKDPCTLAVVEGPLLDGWRRPRARRLRGRSTGSPSTRRTPSARSAPTVAARRHDRESSPTSSSARSARRTARSAHS
jgi:hypothetical protein